MPHVLAAAQSLLHRSILGRTGSYRAAAGAPPQPVHLWAGHRDDTQDAGLAACVTAKVEGWSFAGVKDGHLKNAFVFQKAR